MNYFQELNNLDVSAHVEKKGGFNYLSWTWAVQTLGKVDHEANWEVIEFDGLPYLKTEVGFFVRVSVTCKGITKSQWHPVLDNRNQPIKTPNCFQINTSIQRCLVKAIALHGLGLFVYAGEDLPEEVKATQMAEKYVTADQSTAITDMINDNNLDMKAWQDYFQKKCGTRNIEELPSDAYDKVMDVIHKALERRSKNEAA